MRTHAAATALINHLDVRHVVERDSLRLLAHGLTAAAHDVLMLVDLVVDRVVAERGISTVINYYPLINIVGGRLRGARLKGLIEIGSGTYVRTRRVPFSLRRI